MLSHMPNESDVLENPEFTKKAHHHEKKRKPQTYVRDLLPHDLLALVFDGERHSESLNERLNRTTMIQMTIHQFLAQFHGWQFVHANAIQQRLAI